MSKALVIIDMQNDFVTGPLGNPECQAVVPKIVHILKNNSYDKLIFTRDTHTEDYLNTQEGKNLPVEHCIRGTDGWNIVKEILEAASEYDIVDKITFGSVELAQQLKDYEEIDLVGVCTGICVISNALIIKAINPETKINVIEDATACVTPDSKQTAIDAMKLCQIYIK